MSLGHREWKVGQHLIGFEPPDILWAKCRGLISVEEAVRMAALSHEVGSSQPVFLVVEVTEVGQPNPEVGRYFSENLRFERLLGILYIGTRLIHRAAAKGILLAAHLTEQTTDADVLNKAHFVSSKEEALERIARLRADARGAQST